MTFRWAWNQRTAWREKACGRSRPENTRSSRDSRTGWGGSPAPRSQAGGHVSGRDAVPSRTPLWITRDALVIESRRFVRPAAHEIADWTGVLPREVRAYKDDFGQQDGTGELWPNDLEATYQE